MGVRKKPSPAFPCVRARGRALSFGALSFHRCRTPTVLRELSAVRGTRSVYALAADSLSALFRRFRRGPSFCEPFGASGFRGFFSPPAPGGVVQIFHGVFFLPVFSFAFYSSPIALLPFFRCLRADVYPLRSVSTLLSGSVASFASASSRRCFPNFVCVGTYFPFFGRWSATVSAPTPCLPRPSVPLFPSLYFSAPYTFLPLLFPLLILFFIFDKRVHLFSTVSFQMRLQFAPSPFSVPFMMGDHPRVAFLVDPRSFRNPVRCWSGQDRIADFRGVNQNFFVFPATAPCRATAWMRIRL